MRVLPAPSRQEGRSPHDAYSRRIKNCFMSDLTCYLWSAFFFFLQRKQFIDGCSHRLYTKDGCSHLAIIFWFLTPHFLILLPIVGTARYVFGTRMWMIWECGVLKHTKTKALPSLGAKHIAPKFQQHHKHRLCRLKQIQMGKLFKN